MSYPIHVLRGDAIETVMAETNITEANQPNVVVDEDGNRYLEHPTRALVWLSEEDADAFAAARAVQAPADEPEAPMVDSEGEVSE